VDGKRIGACWMRCIRGGVGLGYVDDETPQLGIALLPEYRGRGFGRQLMLGALRAARAHGYRQVSLTVHPQNPAIVLYESCGFVKRDIRNTYHLMVATL
jgi:ribosomal protein S18 acetylase RimI-like enzyme